jgi:hypothetical protein
MTYQDSSHRSSSEALARFLGWFSIGLGVTELLAPRSLTRMLGMEGAEDLVRAYGLREIATGIGALKAENPAPWIWGRVGGDALDIATVAMGERDDNPQKQNVSMAILALIGVAALDLAVAARLSAEERELAAT